MSIEIVSDPEIMGGRYCFKGTRMPAGAVKRMARDRNGGPAWVIANYRHIPVTQEHIDAAIAFDYAPIYAEAELEYIEEATVICRCGDDAGFMGSDDMFVCSTCGKRWQLTITEVEP